MLIAGNWKMNTDLPEAVRLAESVSEAVGRSSGVDVIVCPPFVSLDAVYNALRASDIALGAQDVSDEEQGARTGDVSAAMLKSVGCAYAIVGHSERRHYAAEGDALVARKAARALAHGLKPIVCVGETLDERRSGSAQPVVERQIEAVYGELDAAAAGQTVIAYEPVWAIGTGETATPAQAQEMHAFIRAWLRSRYGAEVAAQIPLLYGGSMKPGNAADLLAQPDVDGGLIGGASLDPASFAAIVQAAARART